MGDLFPFQKDVVRCTPWYLLSFCRTCLPQTLQQPSNLPLPVVNPLSIKKKMLLQAILSCVGVYILQFPVWARFFFLPFTPRWKFPLFGEAEAQMKDLSTQTPVLHSYSIGSSTRWTSSFSGLTQIKYVMVNLCLFFFFLQHSASYLLCQSFCSYGESSECLMQNLVRFF